MQPTAEGSVASRTSASSGGVTWADYVRLDDDDRRELAMGRLVEAEVPTPLHSWIIAMLTSYLNNWALPRKLGFALSDGVKLRIDEEHGRIPDAAFIRTGNRLRIESVGIVSGTPDVVVEVVSSGASDKRRDRIHKLREYERLGVPEYWLVDADARTFERLVLHEGAYSIRASLANEEVFTSPDYEGLEIPLAQLWTLPGVVEPPKEG